MRYLELDELFEIIRAVTGPRHTVRDAGLLSSAVQRPRAIVFGVEPYPTLSAKAAAVLHSIARNHALVDGDKQVAWLACRATLRFNGVDLTAPANEAVALVEAIARGDLEVDGITKQLERWSSA